MPVWVLTDGRCHGVSSTRGSLVLSTDRADPLRDAGCAKQPDGRTHDGHGDTYEQIDPTAEQIAWTDRDPPTASCAIPVTLLLEFIESRDPVGDCRTACPRPRSPARRRGRTRRRHPEMFPPGRPRGRPRQRRPPTDPELGRTHRGQVRGAGVRRRSRPRSSGRHHGTEPNGCRRRMHDMEQAVARTAVRGRPIVLHRIAGLAIAAPRRVLVRSPRC